MNPMEEMIRRVTDREIPDNPKFDTLEEAMAYAKRITALKPGDTVYIKAEGKNPEEAVFVSFGDSGACHLLRWDDDKELVSTTCGQACIRFSAD